MNESPRKVSLAETRSLLFIAWPMFIAQLAQMGTGVVDTLMAGNYGVRDLAAIAVGYNIWLPIWVFILGMMLAVTAIVAQDFGAGRVEKIRDALPQSLWLALLLGIIAAPLCYSADPLLGLLNLDPATREKSLDYLQACAFGLPAAAIFQALRCHTQGIGVLKPFAYASVIGFLANIPLNYAFIYGKWGAPELGAAGCGWATAISMWLGPILIAFYIGRSRALRDYLPPFQWVPPKARELLAIWRLGLPIGLTLFLEIAVFSVLGLMIATLGDSAMGAHQIAFNVWDVVYIPLISLGAAIATRVGHAIGAENRDGVVASIATGSLMMALIALMATAMLLAYPELIVRAYTDDQAILALALALIRLAALFIIFDAVQVVTSFSLRAFKDTRYPFAIMCFAYWGVSVPLGYWWGLEIAANPAAATQAFWIAMIIGIAIASALISWRLLYRLRQPLPQSQSSAQGDIQTEF
ncbi:MAG: MATE family efflux transporter [Pseudomonadota bacterium]